MFAHFANCLVFKCIKTSALLKSAFNLNMKLITNNKGGMKLCYAGQAYTKKITLKTTICWECNQRKCHQCKGALITDINVSPTP